MGPLKGELKAAREAFLRGDYAVAVQHCSTAIKLSPGSYDAHLYAPLPHENGPLLCECSVPCCGCGCTSRSTAQ